MSESACASRLCAIVRTALLVIGASASQCGCGATDARTGDDYVSSVSLRVHEKTSTILVVNWTQTRDADSTWLEFTLEDGARLESRPQPGSKGPHEDVALGVPAETEVTLSIVSERSGVRYRSREYAGKTGTLPPRLPVAEVTVDDPERRAPERYLLGAVEDSIGACGAPCYNVGMSWIYILDRKGRIVWYYGDAATNAASAYPRVARDGEYLWLDERPTSDIDPRGALKMTLDGRYFEPVTFDISECFDVTEDGGVLFDTKAGVLSELDARGKLREIWSCPEHFGKAFDCFSNTVNWDAAADSILLSYPKENTLVEIDRSSGAVVGQYGAAPGSYEFSPADWQLEYPHFPNLTPDRTLLVSQHMPGYSDTYQPVAGEHAFSEFTIDREHHELVQKWLYRGEEWPLYKGMAVRLSNGNTLVNYGSAGVIQELTRDEKTVYAVKFDLPEGDDFYNKMVGGNLLIDDLYALNGGPRP